jgi:hypothetical protein
MRRRPEIATCVYVPYCVIKTVSRTFLLCVAGIVLISLVVYGRARYGGRGKTREHSRCTAGCGVLCYAALMQRRLHEPSPKYDPDLTVLLNARRTSYTSGLKFSRFG